MGRPALSAPWVLAALAACSGSAPPAARAAPAPLDLPPAPEASATRVLGDDRGAVLALIDGYRDALAARDVPRLRALLAPSIGAEHPGLAMSREAWLARGDALFTAAGASALRLRQPPSVRPFGACAAHCPATLGPGEWAVTWLAAAVRVGPTRDPLIPATLRVAVVDGTATVVGMDDAVVYAHAPLRQRVSGWPRP